MTNYKSVTSATFPNVDLKLWLIGTLIATCSYGVVLTLFLAYLHNFIRLRSQPKSNLDPAGAPCRSRIRYLFLLYTVVMFSLSTTAFLAGSMAIVELLFPSAQGVNTITNSFSRYGEASAMVLASWASDALMVWRCLIIYQDASKTTRTAIVTLLSTLALISLGTGLAYVATGLTVLNLFMPMFAGAAALLNATITILIVSRIWHHHKFINDALGTGYRSIFTRLIHLLVESAALIVVFNIAHVLMVPWPNHALVISHQFLVHIYVISTFLILYRVATNAHRSSRNDSSTCGRQTASLMFTHTMLSADLDSPNDEENNKEDR